MAKKTTAAAASAATAEKTYRVIINKDTSPGGKSDASLTINGKIVQIQRGVEVQLTEAMMEVLRNAEVRGYEACANGDTVVVPGMPRFSYVMLGEVVAATPADDGDETDDDPTGIKTSGNGTGFAAP